jgi:hypothetical protein
MSWFINLRGGAYGAVCAPYVLQGDPQSLRMSALSNNAISIAAKGKNVLLATHGFNVSYESGLRSLGHLETALDLAADEFFIGVLWPGDWVIPAINYPFEDKIASQSGKYLGDFCGRYLKSVRGLNFVSHSLGARVILEAIIACTLPVRSACITAGAVNAGCLTEEYQAAARKCQDIRTLSSRADTVLQFAFPPGDAAADLLDPDHPPFEPAMGRGGPEPLLQSGVFPTEIPDASGYNHGDYLPPDVLSAEIVKWQNVARFMAASFRNRSSPWP